MAVSEKAFTKGTTEAAEDSLDSEQVWLFDKRQSSIRDQWKCVLCVRGSRPAARTHFHCTQGTLQYQ